MGMFYRSLFVLFLLAIVLFVLLRFTDSDYPIGLRLRITASYQAFGGIRLLFIKNISIKRRIYFLNVVSNQVIDRNI
jgi:hypothetical protein